MNFEKKSMYPFLQTFSGGVKTLDSAFKVSGLLPLHSTSHLPDFFAWMLTMAPGL